MDLKPRGMLDGPKAIGGNKLIFESHAHYDDLKFEEDREEVLKSFQDHEITKVINVAADMKSSLTSVELAKEYSFIYATVGVHPHEAETIMEGDIQTLEGLAEYEKVVAIGEIGLDYYYDHSPREVQRFWFKKQIHLAKKLGLPIVVHSRDAAKDTFDLIEESNAKEVGGVIHCYSGSKETAIQYTKLGFYIGIGGVITYKNARTVKEVVEAIPLSSILIETDSPYLSPVPNRGKRNDSRNLPYIIEAIANIKSISKEEVIKTTYENGMKLFLQMRQH